MPLKVLIVEDNRNQARALQALLRLRGYEVETAESVQDAVGKLQSLQFNILVSDLNLADGSGTDILRKVQLDGLPSVAMSGAIDDESKAAAMNAGFREFLLKPFEVGELQLVIERLSAASAS